MQDTITVPSEKLGFRITRPAPTEKGWVRIVSTYRKDECSKPGTEDIGGRKIATVIRIPGRNPGDPKSPEDRDNIMGPVKKAVGIRYNESDDNAFGWDYWDHFVVGKEGGTVTTRNPAGETWKIRGTDVRLGWNERATALQSEAESRGVDYFTRENMLRQENSEMVLYEAYIKKVS